MFSIVQLGGLSGAGVADYGGAVNVASSGVVNAAAMTRHASGSSGVAAYHAVLYSKIHSACHKNAAAVSGRRGVAADCHAVHQGIGALLAINVSSAAGASGISGNRAAGHRKARNAGTCNIQAAAVTACSVAAYFRAAYIH